MKDIKKLMITLVALLALTTGAWATEFTSLKVGDVLHVGDAINTGTNYKVYGLYLDAGYQPATLVRANIGTNDITESETGAYYLIKGDNDFYYGIIWGDGLEGGYWPVTDTSDGISVTAITPGDYTELTFAVHEGAAASSGPEVAWTAASKTGQFTMPGGNVTLEPEYYPQAALTAAPTAINDVPATTDGAIVNAGTVANIGSTETAQGTVMYYVSPTALDEAALLALAADKWTADVPTAEKLAEGEAYVYYYVRGNDSDTDEENFSDGDILSANALTVTIAAEPTYAVTFKAANANTIEAGKATVTVGGTAATVTEGKLQGVKMGSEVKVKANTGYKFRKVEVKKKSAYEHSITIAVDPSTTGAIATAPAMTIEFNTGETWADVAARYDWLDTYETYTVFYKDNNLNGDVHDANGGVKPGQTIDPNGSYHWGM